MSLVLILSFGLLDHYLITSSFSLGSLLVPDLVPTNNLSVNEKEGNGDPAYVASKSLSILADRNLFRKFH